MKKKHTREVEEGDDRPCRLPQGAGEGSNSHRRIPISRLEHHARLPGRAGAVGQELGRPRVRDKAG